MGSVLWDVEEFENYRRNYFLQAQNFCLGVTGTNILHLQYTTIVNVYVALDIQSLSYEYENDYKPNFKPKQ